MIRQKGSNVFHLVLVCSMSLVSLAVPTTAFGEDNDADSKLVGTWRVTLFPPGQPPAFSLFVFNTGGTMTERIGAHNISTVSGAWKRTRGHGNFAVTSEGFLDAEGDGVFDLRFQGRWTIHVVGNTLAGTFTVDLLNLDGTLVAPAVVQGAPFNGTRMTVIPE